ELKEFIKDTMYAFLKPQLFCATAGTPTTIAAIQAGMTYENYDSEKINGAIVTMDDIDKTFTKLLKISIDERSKLVGALRQDLITAGILIYKEVFEATGFKECRVFDDGLREGIALAVCNKINIF
ncbi:MAG: phosphatase, partial [Campylobacterales bacterium]|nr:phosphatase [Campylobacterales bacterium]